MASKGRNFFNHHVRYYLCRRYLNRTKTFNEMTGGLVQDWVEDMEATVSGATLFWEARYQLRSTARYRPVQWAHHLLDPFRTWWKVRRARQSLPDRDSPIEKVDA